MAPLNNVKRELFLGWENDLQIETSSSGAKIGEKKFLYEFNKRSYF